MGLRSMSASLYGTVAVPGAAPRCCQHLSRAVNVAVSRAVARTGVAGVPLWLTGDVARVPYPNRFVE